MGSAKHKRAFNEHAQNSDPRDFWAQVQRTVNGKVVGEDQIRMIVDAIVAGLELESSDVVLDLCCGNGALSDRIFARCRGGVGVDFAESLVAIAQQHFQRPERSYIVDDVERFVRETSDTARFTKAMCYGSIQLLAPDSAFALLRALRQRFPAIRRLFLGNLPDKDRIRDFYDERTYVPGIEDDHETPIGLWRTEQELKQLAAAAGWKITISRPPAAFYAAHYRYNAVLEPDAAGA